MQVLHTVYKMVEPELPFACGEPDCGMTFTNEDHLQLHTKKHAMALQLGMEQKAVFVADQTPTPTRFIRNCEEVGLFQDLNVNPFDEGFKRAMETKPILCLEATSSSEDLHTPQMAFPLIDADSTLYSSTNNQKNITISRSSSDESGAVKEYETTTISKLTNEVTTISRIIGKQEPPDKNTSNDISLTSNIHQEFVVNKDVVNEKKSVSFKNNVIQIHNDVTIKKDTTIDGQPLITQISYTDSIIKDACVERTNVNECKVQCQKLQNNLTPPPVMSQKSLDLVVDTLTAEICGNEKREQKTTKTRKKTKANKTNEPKSIEDYEVTIKLPNGKRLKLKPEKEDKDKPDIEKFKANEDPLKLEVAHNVIRNKPQVTPVFPDLATGTLIPVKLLAAIPKNPIPPVQSARLAIKKTFLNQALTKKAAGISSDSIPVKTEKNIKSDIDNLKLSHSAASKRYREKRKQMLSQQEDEIRKLKAINEKLMADKALLKMVLTQHLKTCPLGNDLRELYQKLS